MADGWPAGTPQRIVPAAMPFDEPIATEIDGVPVLVDRRRRPVQGGIVFRTGRADESLRTAGISHIVEHLALAPMMYARAST